MGGLRSTIEAEPKRNNSAARSDLPWVSKPWRTPRRGKSAYPGHVSVHTVARGGSTTLAREAGYRRSHEGWIQVESLRALGYME
jgi:hypothetical protein